LDYQTPRFLALSITLRALPEGDVLVTLFRLHDKVRVRVEEGHLAPPETDNPQGATD